MLIEDVGDDIPLEFIRLQTADLSGWDGSDDDAEFAAMAHGVESVSSMSLPREHVGSDALDDEDVLGRDVRKRTTPSLFSRFVRLVRPRRSHHEVFVAYRRDLGAPVARLVSTELKNRGPQSVHGRREPSFW